MTWASLIEAHQAGTREVLAPASLKARSWRLGVFLEFVNENGPADPKKVTESEITAFHQRLIWKPGRSGRMFSPATIQAILGAVTQFLRWAVTNDHLLFDPTTELEPRTPPHRLPRVPTVKEMKSLLAVPDRSPLGLRDRAIIEVLYVLGLRRGECFRLDVEDVDLDRRQLSVHGGKFSKDRLLPLSLSLVKTLSRYLQKGRPKLRPPATEKALFLSSTRGNRLSYPALLHRVQFLGKQVGLALYPHLLRHACATHLLEGGADIRYVQELLGHVCVTSTQVYTKISPVELREAFRETHPRSRRDEEDPLGET